MAHRIRCRHDLRVIRAAIDEWKPHIAFNLLEEFDGVAVYDQNVVSYLELLKVPYTGCNPRGCHWNSNESLGEESQATDRGHPEIPDTPGR